MPTCSRMSQKLSTLAGPAQRRDQQFKQQTTYSCPSDSHAPRVNDQVQDSSGDRSPPLLFWKCICPASKTCFMGIYFQHLRLIGHPKSVTCPTLVGFGSVVHPSTQHRDVASRPSASALASRNPASLAPCRPPHPRITPPRSPRGSPLCTTRLRQRKRRQ